VGESLPRRALANFLVFAGVKHDFVGVLRRHARMSLGPVVRNGIRKNIAIAVERAGRDGPRSGVKS